jgi:hypothetical protein
MTSQLQQACQDKGITLTSTHMEVDLDKKYPHDKWSVVIHYGDKSSKPVEYSTGIGHRKLAARGAGFKQEVFGKWYCQGNTYTTEDLVRANYLRPVQPDVADVVSCLLLDGTACGQSFSEWCSDFGYDTDSRKALAIYEGCQENGDKLRAVLGHDLVNELSTLEH